MKPIVVWVLTFLLLVPGAAAQTPTSEILPLTIDVYAYGSTYGRNIDEGTCALRSRLGTTTLQIRTAESSLFEVELTNGDRELAGETPRDRIGCLFQVEVDVPASDAYTFVFDDTELATLDRETLSAADNHVVLEFGPADDGVEALSGGVRPTPAPTVEPSPTPEPTVEPTPIRTPVPTPTSVPEPTPTPVPVPTVAAGLQDDGTYLVVGTFALLDSDGVTYINETYCAGNGGYSDIQPGAQVTARDGQNNILAVAELETTSRSSSSACYYEFTMAVPETQFYQFELNRRGTITYTFADLEEADWRVEFGLG